MENNSYDVEMAGRPPKTAAPTFGQHLAAIRKARGMTQPQLAQMLKVSLQSIVFYERYATNPTADILKRTAHVLGVSVDELLGIKPVRAFKPGPPSKLQRLTEKISDLPRNQQEKIASVIEAFVNQHSNSHQKAA